MTPELIRIEREFKREEFPPVWQYNTIARIQKDFKTKGVSSILHGSFASKDFIEGWSDVDVIVSSSNADLSYLERLLYKIDPLAHHGFIVESDASHRTPFPSEIYHYGVRLSGEGQVEAEPNDPVRAKKSLERFADRARGWVENPPNNDYEFKIMISTALLSPSLLLQARGICVYKKESFERVKVEFPNLDFSIIGEAEIIRREWRVINLLRFVPDGVILALPSSFSRLLVRAGRKLASLSGNVWRTDALRFAKLFYQHAESALKSIENEKTI